MVEAKGINMGKKYTPLKAIRKKCIDCSGFSLAEVRNYFCFKNIYVIEKCFIVNLSKFISIFQMLKNITLIKKEKMKMKQEKMDFELVKTLQEIYSDVNKQYKEVCFLSRHGIDFTDEVWDYFQTMFEFQKQNIPSQFLHPQYNPIEVFPEAKEIIPEKIKEWKQRKKQVISDFRRLLSKYKNHPDKLFLINLWKPKYEQKLKEIDRHISRLKEYLQKNKKIDLEKIKEIPLLEVITSFMDIPYKNSGNKYYLKCPFHDDNRPSFVIYPNSNTFHCFGCGASGDVIDFVMKIKNCDFKTSVNYLNNFIGG
jgi:DNA primase